MAARIVKINKKTLYQIIKEVKKRPCLWSTEDEYYNNRRRVAVAWDEITTLLNLPEAFIRAKWKNMRDLFKRELKKCSVNTLGEYTGKWRHFEIMWFLHKPEHVTAHDENNDSSHEVIVKQEGQNHRHTSSTLDTSNDSEEEQFTNRVLPVSDGYHEPLQLKARRPSQEDYDMMFLKSLAPYFREMDSVRKLKIRNRIQDIIITEISSQHAQSSR